MNSDPIRDFLRDVHQRIKGRALYYIARLIVFALFISLLFFPGLLAALLGNQLSLGATILCTAILAITLFADLMFEHQRSITSIITKYLFLTLSVILLYGLFFYVNATQLEPPGIHYLQGLNGEHDIERDAFYLSGTTYYTIGYGDMVPLGGYARAAAVSEAAIGNVINLIVLAMAFLNFVKKG